MALVGSKNTKPELIVRKYLFSKGLRYRINLISLPGKPDIVLSKYKTVVFVHGCFWHGHKLNNKWHRNIPTTNRDFWIEKIQKNEQRDEKVKSELESLGWNVLIIWECELSSKKNRESTLELLYKNIINYTI